MKILTKEEALHRTICSHLSWNHPQVMFNSDMSGVKLSMQQAIKAKNLRSSRGFPDLEIYEARGGYFGLLIEIKTINNSPFLKDGVTIKSDKHVIEQAHVIQKLKKRGYFAKFGVGEKHIKEIIELYLALPVNPIQPMI